MPGYKEATSAWVIEFEDSPESVASRLGSVNTRRSIDPKVNIAALEGLDLVISTLDLVISTLTCQSVHGRKSE